MNEVLELLRVAGPWGGPVLVFGYLYVKRHIATGRELAQLEETCKQLTRDRERERAELREELSFWRDIAWSSSRIADQVVGHLPARKDSG